ncbi:MAG: flap endonuclease-1 [Thermofilum sp.]
MGCRLTPLVTPLRIGLAGVTGRTLAVDALNAIYQFLALVRTSSGGFLRNRKGYVTSHLVGMASRYSKLAADNACRFIFVFDGPPHPLKRAELERRERVRERALEEYKLALLSGNLEKALSKAVVAIRVDQWIIESSKKLVTLMGFPVVDAPSDAEAQAAFIVARGDAWAVSSQDWDSLLYGADRLVRYLTLTGFEWLPSKQVARKLEPELVELGKLLNTLGLTRKQLVEVAVLSGTDYNRPVRGIGPLKAYKLIKLYGSLEKLPSNLRKQLPENYEDIVNLFLHPRVKEDYEIDFREPRVEELYRFLVDENDFSPERARTIISRLQRSRETLRAHQRTIDEYN